MSAELEHVKITRWIGTVISGVCNLHVVHNADCGVLGLLQDAVESLCRPNAEDLSMKIEELHNIGGLSHIIVSLHGLTVLFTIVVLRTVT